MFKKGAIKDEFAAYYQYAHPANEKSYWIQCCSPRTEAEVDSFIATEPDVTVTAAPQDGFKQVVHLTCGSFRETYTFVL